MTVRQYTTGEARDNFAELVSKAAFGAQRVVITRHGKTAAAIVPISDLELLNELERMIDVEEARKALIEAQTGTISLKDLKKQLGV